MTTPGMTTRLKGNYLVISGTNKNARYDFSHSTLSWFREKDYPIPSEAEAIEIEKLNPQPLVFDDYPFKTIPWQNQREGMAHVLKWKRAALMHGMGCGKSKTILDVIGFLIWTGRIRHALIVCPLSVFTVWPVQFNRHAAFGKLVIVKTTKKGKALLEGLSPDADPTIVVVNYEKLASLKDDIKNVNFGMIAADEATKIKNPRAKRTKILAEIADPAPYVVVATGTPVSKNLVDVFGMFRVMDWFWLSKSSWFFRNRYCVMGGWMQHSIVGYKNETELRRIIDTPSHIVTKAQALPDLPPKIHQERVVSMDSEQRRIYKETKRKFLVELTAGTIDIKNAASRLVKLQEIANGFVVLENGQIHRFSETKLNALLEVIEEIDDRDHLTVWCKFREDIASIAHKLAHSVPDRQFYAFHGDTKDRDELLDRFRATGGVLAIQTQTGGMGIDLTCSAYAVRYSRLFSYMDEEQAEDRHHRPGQQRPVTYLDLIVENSVDRKIQSVLSRGRNLSAWLMEREGNLAELFNDI